MLAITITEIAIALKDVTSDGKVMKSATTMFVTTKNADTIGEIAIALQAASWNGQEMASVMTSA